MLMLMEMIRVRLAAARRDDGVTAIEYGLIASLIAVFIIGALVIVGGALEGVFTDISDAL